MKSRLIAVGAVTMVIASIGGILGCGGSGATQTGLNPNGPEVSPAGDIPDNQAFVVFRQPAAGFEVKVPEGWSRSSQGGATTFTDKLNSIRIESSSAASAPTSASGRAELQSLATTVPGFKAGKVTTVERKAGPAILITYTGTGPADPVTGKSVPDAFERYLFRKNGTLVTLTLSGPVGADNVDPWRIVTDSLRWTA